MQQLPLAISPPPAPSFDNFLAGRNAEALAAVRALAEGRSPEAIVYLWGEAGSGRTHLAAAALRTRPELVAVDGVEGLDAEAEQALFNAVNAARGGGPPVLATGDAPPALLRLREDIRTRLAWGLVYELKPLSEAEKRAHLRGEAARRGLLATDEVLDYLLARLPRNLYTLTSFIDYADRRALARQRALTLPFVREVLAEYAERGGVPRQGALE